MPQRFDRSELRKATRTREGWLRADGYLTRTGVFEYRLGDGTVRRELRLPEEVFHEDALASFTLAPLTREHPERAVTADNWRHVAVGTVGEVVKRDGDFVRATLLFTDSDTIRDLEKKERQELSCGYTCDLEEKPGEWNGQKYDCVQRQIRGNHVALVTRGRAGPEVRVRLDSADGLESSLTQAAETSPAGRHTPGGSPVVKARIDGVEYEVSEQAKQALEKVEAARKDADERLAAEAKAQRADADKQRGRADELQKKLEESEKARADATSPERVAELVKARVALEREVGPILGDKVKLDGLSERAVKLEVLKKLGTEVKADASDDYVQGRYESAIDAHKKQKPTPLQVARGATQTPTADGNDDVVAAARKRMLEDARTAWKPKAQNA